MVTPELYYYLTFGRIFFFFLHFSLSHLFLLLSLLFSLLPLLLFTHIENRSEFSTCSDVSDYDDVTDDETGVSTAYSSSPDTTVGTPKKGTMSLSSSLSSSPSLSPSVSSSSLMLLRPMRYKVVSVYCKTIDSNTDKQLQHPKHQENHDNINETP